MVVFGNVGVKEEVGFFVSIILLDCMFKETAFGLSDVVGGALWFRAGSMVNEVVLVLMLDLVFDEESSQVFWWCIDCLYLGVVYDFLHFVKYRWFPFCFIAYGRGKNISKTLSVELYFYRFLELSVARCVI